MRKKRNAGFTLTEAIIAVAIIGIIFGIAPRMFIQVNRFVIMNRTRIELQREARMMLSLINRNLRQARSGTLQIDSIPGQPYYSRIAFTRVDGMTFSFYQTGTRLIMVTSNTTKTLSSNLRYLAFSPPRSEDLTIISVALTLEKAIQEGRTKALHMASEKVMVMN